MVLGNPGGSKGRADPSAAKKFEENCEKSVEIAQDRKLSNLADVPMVHSPSHDPGVPSMFNSEEDILKSTANDPANLSEFEHPSSPPSSYDNRFFTDEDFLQKTKGGKVCEVLPPELPPQLDVVLDMPLFDKPSPLTNHKLPRPEFTQLNHLYARKNDQYVGFSSTQRIGNKYVTAILYKPLPKTK